MGAQCAILLWVQSNNSLASSGRAGGAVSWALAGYREVKMDNDGGCGCLAGLLISIALVGGVFSLLHLHPF